MVRPDPSPAAAPDESYPGLDRDDGADHGDRDSGGNDAPGAPDSADSEELTPALRLEPAQALELLANAELTVQGQLVDASNATLYVRAELDSVAAAAVYKPVAGERPLWDFPDGTLAQREVAAYTVSAATGWTVIPPTVLREGPYGPGMVQLWIDTDDNIDVRTLLRRSAPVLRTTAVLDAVINNADRKGGHILPDVEDHVYGVDHGVCFSSDEKLRTVIWNWAGEPLHDDEIDVLARLSRDFDRVLAPPLGELLTTLEVRRTRQRIDRLLRSSVLPQPSRNRHSVPWPPF